MSVSIEVSCIERFATQRNLLLKLKYEKYSYISHLNMKSLEPNRFCFTLTNIHSQN